MNEIKIKQQDKVENVKQVKKEIQRVFQNRIIPHENHTLFEFNKKTKELKIVLFDANTTIKWEDAVKGFISPKKEVTKNIDCIYFSCLNRKNAIKVLKRDYNITL